MSLVEKQKNDGEAVDKCVDHNAEEEMAPDDSVDLVRINCGCDSREIYL